MRNMDTFTSPMGDANRPPRVVMRGGGTNARKRQATVVEGEKGGLQSSVQAAFLCRYFSSNCGYTTSPPPHCTHGTDAIEGRWQGALIYLSTCTDI